MADEPETEEVEELETGADDDIDTGEDAPEEVEETDEGDAEEQGEDEPDAEGDEPPRRQSRGANLRHRAQEAEVRAARAEGELEALRRGAGQSQPDRARQEQEERERLSVMSPDERTAFILEKHERSANDRIAQAERRVAARMDRSEFAAMLVEKPHLKRYEAEVSKRFDEAFQKGGFVERAAILRFVIGDAVMKKAPAAADKQRRQADARRAAQKTKPGSGRSDVAANRGKRGKTAADRLTDVTF